MSRTRLVTAAQNASAEVWSSDSWPPALSHLCDGAGCSLKEIASYPHSSAAWATRVIPAAMTRAGS